MRSYNRPNYLQLTLQSLNKSDIDLSYKKIIYDDASTDKKTISILNKCKNRYNIIFNNKNYKQQSMIKALELIENEDFDYLCYLDNDAIVNKNFIKKCIYTYKKIKKEQQLNNSQIILSGFDTKNHKIINKYNDYNLKKSIGGIHMFFHKNLLKNIKNWWVINEDWGIVNNFKGKLFTTNPSIVQHIGKIGDHSSKNNYDLSNNFIEMFSNINNYYNI